MSFVQGFTEHMRDAGGYYERYVSGVNKVETKAHKCPSCRQAFRARKISQIYCSAKCRQVAYRKRKRCDVKLHRKESQPALVVICEHCGGTFWAKRARARFCSTSCRTLYHRAMRAAIPQALVEIFDVPKDKAADIVETQLLREVKGLLADVGYRYSHRQRRWLN